MMYQKLYRHDRNTWTSWVFLSNFVKFSKVINLTPNNGKAYHANGEHCWNGQVSKIFLTVESWQHIQTFGYALEKLSRSYFVIKIISVHTILNSKIIWKSTEQGMLCKWIFLLITFIIDLHVKEDVTILNVESYLSRLY